MHTDILRGVEAIPEKLHPSVHRHAQSVPVRTVEPDASRLRLHRDQSVFRLRRNGHHSVQLHIFGHDRDNRGG